MRVFEQLVESVKDMGFHLYFKLVEWVTIDYTECVVPEEQSGKDIEGEDGGINEIKR